MDYEMLTRNLLSSSWNRSCNLIDLERREASNAIIDLLARAEEAEAEVSELRKRLAEAEAACAYHKYRRGEAAEAALKGESDGTQTDIPR